MTPPFIQVQQLQSLSWGILVSNTVGEPGTQGAGVIGRHGTGEPRAAITPGFEGLEHMPKLGMFNSGL
ncbi:hypothetical protein D9M71_490390 [compost metagenome]